MENTHEFKPVHDPLFCKEGDIPFDVHLVNKDGSEFKTTQEEFHYPKDIPACSSEDTCEAVQELLDTKDESYALYLSIKEDVYKNIQYHEDIINDLLIEIKRNLVMIDESKHRLKICYERYIKII